MARPTWTDIASTDLDQDSPVDETLVEAWEDNLDAARIVLCGKEIAEQTTSATSPTVLADFYIDIPTFEDYTGIQRTMNCGILVKVDAGTGRYALRDQASPTTGSAVDSTSATYEPITVSVDLDSDWQGTKRLFQLLGEQVTSGAIYLKSIGFSWYMEF